MAKQESLELKSVVPAENPVDILPKKRRDSNLELYRIILMLAIIAHHYVVNSGLFPKLGADFGLKSIIFYLFGMWGKTGINCFVLITGFFMCKSQISLKKFLKMVFEVEFYTIVIWLLFYAVGYRNESFSSFIRGQVALLEISNGFTSCFLFFYLFIPFLNILVRHMNKEQHKLLVCLCLLVYTGIGTLPQMVRMNYVEWFVVLYLIASYIRLYGLPHSDSLKWWGILCGLSVMIAMGSVICLAILFHGRYVYSMVQDSNHIMAVVVSVCVFMTFKNIHMSYNRVINTISQSIFGVLLIHANSDTMRQWLWYDLLHVREQYDSDYAIILAMTSVMVIFGGCILIDQFRIFFIEKPLFSYFEKKKSNKK